MNLSSHHKGLFSRIFQPFNLKALRYFLWVLSFWLALTYLSHVFNWPVISYVNLKISALWDYTLSKPKNLLLYWKERLHFNQTLFEENQKLKNDSLESDAKIHLLEQNIREMSALKEIIDGLSLRNPDENSWFVRVYGVIQDLGKVRLYAYSKQENQFPKDAVLYNHQGLIGKVNYSRGHRLEAIAITDCQFIVPVRNTRNGILFMSFGEGNNRLRLEPIDSSNDIDETPLKAGDVLVTSGLDDIFPENIPVGRVKEERNTIYYAIPCVTLAKIDFAKIITKESEIPH